MIGESYMHTRVAFLSIVFLVSSAVGQDSVPSQTAPNLSPIAVASIHVDKHSFKSGEVIKLTVLLEAGPGGVYIPKSWGEMGGGIPGFSVNLTTLSGKGAETCGSATDAWGPKHSDATVVLNRDFIFLPAHHIVGLRTEIDCPTKRPGKYLISMFYSPFNVDADEVAQLPETHGLVLRKGVRAKPVLISIN
jgi:hypothetical protein